MNSSGKTTRDRHDSNLRHLEGLVEDEFDAGPSTDLLVAYAVDYDDGVCELAVRCRRLDAGWSCQLDDVAAFTRWVAWKRPHLYDRPFGS